MNTSVKLRYRNFVNLTFIFSVLVGTGILVQKFRLANLGHSIGMADTDTQGTMWFVWAQCSNSELLKNFGADSTNSLINFPNGFDFTNLPFSNLVDLVRFGLLRSQNCSPNFLLAEFSIFPILAMTLASFSYFMLGRSAGLRLYWALFFSILATYTPISLLATRTSISNNVIFFGVFGIAMLLKYMQSRRLRFLVFSAILMLLQTWSNLYNAAGLMITAVLIVVSIFGIKSLCVRLWLLLLGPSFFLIVYEYLPDMIFLSTSNNQEIYRPVNGNQELLSPLSIFGRPPRLFTNLASQSHIEFVAGWIPYVHILIFIIGLILVFRNKASTEILRYWRGLTATGIFLVILTRAFTPFALINRLYFELFGFLRGVSNFDKFVIPIMTLSSLVVVQHAASSSILTMRNSVKLLPVLAILLTIVGVKDAIPNSASFSEVNSTSELENYYRQLQPEFDNKVVAHLPDDLYNGSWGFPSGHIQLAQIFHGQRILNGREYSEIDSKCSALPLPTNDFSLQLIHDRGADIIVYYPKRVMQEQDWYVQVEIKEALNEGLLVQIELPTKLAEAMEKTEVGSSMLSQSKIFEIYSFTPDAYRETPHICRNVNENKN